MKNAKYGLYTGSICLLIGLFFLGSLGDYRYASASDYPNRPITLIIPYAPGGTTDVVARALTDSMEKHLKQPVVVVSKPGGGTTIGGNAVASAKADGYTLGFLSASTYVPDLLGFTFKIPYSSQDLKPISGVIDVPMGILSKGDAPWNNLKELVEYARQNPSIKVAILGKNNSSNFLIILLAKQEKINFVGVPFDGGSKMVPPLLGGHVSAGITGMDPTIKSLLDAKRLKVLAVCLKRRIDILPDTPCLAELGYKVPFIFTVGVFGPKGTPEEVVKRIDEVVRKIVEEPDFKTKVYNSTAQLNYLDAASYEKTLTEYREFLQVFLKEEGLL